MSGTQDCGGDIAPMALKARSMYLPVTLRVYVPKNWVLGFWVIVIIVQLLGKYMTIRYLDA